MHFVLFLCLQLMARAEAPVALRMMAVSEIRPTQFSVGRREVERRANKLRAMSDSALDRFLAGKPVKGVLGPGGKFFAVDGHHLALAAKKAGIKSVYVQILGDFSDLSRAEFWRKMDKKGWLYLLKQGRGPLTPRSLPRTLSQMTDDPYRSLASAVRRLGGFEKKHEHFSEFQW